MSDFRIIGNSNPVVGVTETYTVSDFFEKMPTNQDFTNTKENESVKWEVYVLENGKWRKTKENDKTGKKITYKFFEKALTRKGIRLLAKKGDKTARLDIKPLSAKPKIDHIELLDKNGSKIKGRLSYGQTVKARVFCINMEKQRVHVTLWEDDVNGKGHNKANEKNFIETLSGIVKFGKADIDFLLKPSFAKIATKNGPEKDKVHEYYVTAGLEKIASNNINVDAPEVPVRPFKAKTTPKTPPKPHAPIQQPKTDSPKENPSASPQKTKAQINSVNLTDTADHQIKGIFKEKQIKVWINSTGLKGKKIRLKLYDDDITTAELLFQDEFALESDLHAVVVALNSIPKSKGDDLFEGSEQKLFAEVEVLQTDIFKKSAIVDVDATVFKQDSVEVANKVAKVDLKKGDKKDKETCTCKEYDLIWGGHPNVKCDFRRKVIEISKRQNFDPNHLMAVMWVETNKTFSTSLVKLMPNGKFKTDGTPKKENRGLNENEIKTLPEDFVGAVGLIQFTPVAIEELNNYYGYSLSKRKLALMTQLEQLDYVEKYIEFWIKANKIKSKLTLADLYLLIFSPSKMDGSTDTTTLYKEGTAYYNANKSIDTDKKNGITKKELAHRAYESLEEGSKQENKSSDFICRISDEKKIADNSSNGVLEEMKIIADSHRPYLQETDKNRTADTEEGLAKMDCSEFVSRYLHKLGITKNIIYMTTANMVSESAFRKIIENENIDLVKGSLLSDFKPKKGDIFVWGYTKNGSWSGHTGVVYDYDDTNDVVTILEAIGKSGTVSENDQVKNGGYSGKECTRTAKYGRLKGALYGHAGWHGYFRPKNFTKTL